jgi:ATP-binding protein involved in chromosome partitioning
LCVSRDGHWWRVPPCATAGIASKALEATVQSIWQHAHARIGQLEDFRIGQLSNLLSGQVTNPQIALHLVQSHQLCAFVFLLTRFPRSVKIHGEMGQAARITNVSKIIAVASGKGGVGKTTVAVNLALALREGGARVGLFDADLYGPNVPLMLGVTRERPAQGYVPVARAGSEPYIQPLQRFGITVMSIGFVLGDGDTVLPDSRFAGHIIRQTLYDVLWGELDYLLLDFPPGSGEPQQTLLNTIHLDGVLIVTTPQDLSLMDSSRSLGLFRRACIPILGVVENMSYLNCPHCDKPIDVFFRSSREWGIEDQSIARLGRVPLDSVISRSVGSGHPLVQAAPDAPQAMAFRQIASKLSASLAQL